MTADDPREDAARRLLHSTPVELLSVEPGVFDRLRERARRRQRRRRAIGSGLVAAATAAVVIGAVTLGPSLRGDSRITPTQPGPGLALTGPTTAPGASAPLRIAARIHLTGAGSGPLITAEAPDGAVFYVAQVRVRADGSVPAGTPADSIVRVIDGNGSAQIAEHVPGPALAMAADSTDLFVATSTHVYRYLRSTGDSIHRWPLRRQPSNTAHLVVAGNELWASSGRSCNTCGGGQTLVSMDLSTGTRRVLTDQIGIDGFAATSTAAYYLPYASVPQSPLTAMSATGTTRTGVSLSPLSLPVGRFGPSLVVVVPTGGTGHDIDLVDPRSLRVTHHIASAGEFSYALVDSVVGPVFSVAGCRHGPPVAGCGNDVGTTVVSRIDLVSGTVSGTLSMPGLQTLLGPRPAAVVAAAGGPELVRLR